MDIERHKKQFGSQAENYTKYRLPYSKEVYDFMFSLLPLGSARILDVACGTGKSTEPLIKSGLDIFGLDHDPLMLAEAKKQAEINNLPISYSVGNAEKIPFEDGYFDAVTVGTAFHWFANEKALTEIRRVMKKGGLLFVFWTLTTKDVPEEDSIPGEIFRKFKWEKVPSELRDLGHVSNLFKDNGLEGVGNQIFPFTYNSTVEEQVGLMKTASSYEVLSEEDRELFIDEIRESLTRNLGERSHFTYEEEIQAVYGFKS